MTPIPDKIVHQILDFKKKQEILLLDYKKNGSLEMMYLVQWSILEKLVKVVTSQYRREILKNSSLFGNPFKLRTVFGCFKGRLPLFSIYSSHSHNEFFKISRLY